MSRNALRTDDIFDVLRLDPRRIVHAMIESHFWSCFSEDERYARVPEETRRAYGR